MPESSGCGPLEPAHSCPHRTSPPSTVHRVLTRLGINRLAWMDKPTGRVIRRYERERPCELVHVDIKKLGKILDGRGWKVHGRQAGLKVKGGTYRGRIGYGFIHSAVDDYSRRPTRRSCPTSARRSFGCEPSTGLPVRDRDRRGPH
jgi:hypothetical protein